MLLGSQTQSPSTSPGQIMLDRRRDGGAGKVKDSVYHSVYKSDCKVKTGGSVVGKE